MKRVMKPFQIFTNSPPSTVCIWLNGEPTAVRKRAETVWNGAKYRLATDGAANELRKRAGAVEFPHIICGDFDSIEKSGEMGGAEMIHLPDQDKTDLTKAIDLCLERKNKSAWKFEQIVILGGLNGRFDHTMATLSTLFTFIRNPEIPILVLDGRNLVMALPEGSSGIHVDLEKSTKMCGVIPLAPRATVVSSEGLKYEMKDLPLAFGEIISTSNEVITDKIEIHTSAPLIFTIELLTE